MQTRAYHRFAICEKCADFQDEIERAKRDNKPETVALYRKAKQMHKNDVSLPAVLFPTVAKKMITQFATSNLVPGRLLWIVLVIIIELKEQ